MLGVDFFKAVLVKSVLQSFKGCSMNVVDFAIGPYANRVQMDNVKPKPIVCPLTWWQLLNHFQIGFIY